MSFRKYLKDLDLLDQRLPSAATPSHPKLDPIAATPQELATHVDMLWAYNDQHKLAGKIKDDPLTLPLSLLNAVAEMINIPTASADRTSPVALVTESSGEKDEEPPKPDDRDVFAKLPLLDRGALAYQGFNISNLPPKSDQIHYSATGRPIPQNAVTIRTLRSLFLASDRSLDRLNSAFWPVINDSTDLTRFKGLSTVFPAAHALQMLLILLANKTFHSDMDLKKATALIGDGPLKTSADLGRFIDDITSTSTLANILDRDLAFKPPKDLVHQALQHVQRGSSLDHFPLPVRTALDKILQEQLDYIQSGNTVLPTAILLRFAPYFPPPSLEPSDQIAAMLARESLAPCASADSGRSASDTVVQFGPPEVAFVARQDSRHDSRKDFRPDSRPDSRQDSRNDSRKDFHLAGIPTRVPGSYPDASESI